jgi:site-specific DNA-methyltransferase (adenine-specific)
MKLLNGDCLEELKKLPDNSIDSMVTDPPYGLKFMGKKWDYDVPRVEVWAEALRVLKPGGHALVACGTRTQHRMAVNLEDAGFEIRDLIAWLYGSGFPKNLSVGKAVDKLQGNERDVVGEKRTPDGKKWSERRPKGDITGYQGNREQQKESTQNLETKGNSEWEGWGTALKPAMELWTLCRKPLEQKTIAENVLKWGTGGICIDGCRVGYSSGTKKANTNNCRESLGRYGNGLNGGVVEELNKGRFPSNLIHDGSDEVVSGFPETKSGGSTYNKGTNNNWLGSNKIKYVSTVKDSGSASRFFYCAKASCAERNQGLGGFEEKKGIRTNAPRENEEVKNLLNKNHHPTVKPLKLMQYLIKLTTPPKGTCLDPYMGSGTTGMACKSQGLDFIGIELDQEYFKIAKARIESQQQGLF